MCVQNIRSSTLILCMVVVAEKGHCNDCASVGGGGALVVDTSCIVVKTHSNPLA